MNNFPFTRIVVIGTTSSGKSTLAAKLAEMISGDFIELDSLHWESNWIEAPDHIFRQRVAKATQSEVWVVAGNYHIVRDIVWNRAQMAIWLDYPFHIVFWRLLTRTIRRSITKERLFSDNVENFWTHLKVWSQDSLFNWLIKTYWRRKQEYPKLFVQAENSHLKIIHLKSPAEAEKWLAKVK